MISKKEAIPMLAEQDHKRLTHAQKVADLSEDHKEATVDFCALQLHREFCGCASEMHMKGLARLLWELCEEYER